MAQIIEGGIDIGTCAVDIEKGHRQYSVKYALNDREGVASLLKDIHRLRERRFHAGDYAACDILADLQTAIDKAGLTNRQRQALYWVYERDLSLKETGVEMDISNVAVFYNVWGAVDRLAEVFSGWNYGEITIEYDEPSDSRDEEELDEIQIRNGL